MVAALAACKKPPPAPAIVEVRVVDRSPPADAHGLDLAQLSGAAARAVGEASGVRVTDGGAAGERFRLRVELRLDGAVDEAAKKGVMRAFVVARLLPVDGPVGALSFEQAAVAERAYGLDEVGDRQAAWRAHAERAVADTVRGVGARLKLARGDEAALRQALTGADEDLKDEAVRLAGERRARGLVPELLPLLKSADREIVDRAIGALAAIGDARAVKPLTEVAQFRDLQELPKVLDALSSIGGDEARSYLEFVASGHESEEMRQMARRALGHMERRQKDAAPPR